VGALSAAPTDQELRALIRSQVLDADFDIVGDIWADIIDAYGVQGERCLGLEDRFYLVTVLCGRIDLLHEWLYARCREVEREPDGYLDLWAREHGKSSLITFAGCVQEILRDPEITICIFSHTFGVAKDFLNQIKLEFERNIKLQNLYPEVLYADPKSQATRWSIDGGIVVKRKGNPKEPTLMASGLVDHMPTGAHFALRVYDDTVTPESVTTPEQIQKTTSAWSLSDNLAARGADGHSRAWHIGTRYSFADTYQAMLDMGAVKPRIYPATDDGTMTGKLVLMSQEAWDKKMTTQLPAIIACQLLLNPAAGNEATFKSEWLRYAEIRPATLNVYIMVDPASASRKKGTDSTAMAVVGIDAQRNKYLLDGHRCKMNLKQRWDNMRALRRKWLEVPGVQMVRVGYERYGMDSDLEYFEERMLIDKDAFEVVELAWPREGPGSKFDRVQRLGPDFMQGRFFLAKLCTREEGGKVVEYETSDQTRMRELGQSFRIFKPPRQRDHNNRVYSLNKAFLEEFLVFPFAPHDDLIDATSRIYDMDPVPPVIIDEGALEPETFNDGA
jgi:hypothetical protein